MARIAFLDYDRSNFVNAWVNGGASAVGVGTFVLVGDRIGVAQVDIPVGGYGPVECSKQWYAPLKSGDTPSIGDYVYWDDANGYFTTTVVYDVRPVQMVSSSGNVPSGYITVDLAMTAAATPTP